MPKRIAVSQLNASTIDILNTIRQNASLQYQSSIPEITTEVDIPKVGEVLYGYPALANEFVNALVNRIAFVALNSATFNNAYADLKKGYIEFGETIEEVFTDIINAIAYSAEKAEARELKRYLPNVHTAFHSINWKVMYPVTIEREALRQAFISLQGVQDLIAEIVDRVYTSNEYDEFLLFKYLIIKGINSGKFKPVSVDTSTDMKNGGVAFRATATKFGFMNNAYTESGVRTTTPIERVRIFMDADFNASYDVNVLASAFNMDKATFMGKLHLIDDWTTFDNERFELIRAESDGLEEVTDAELAVMANVKAILVDERWFQIYDNLNLMTEKEVASGLYWNYFYHVWKTVSNSPFSNAVVFIEDTYMPTAPATLTAPVESVSTSGNAVIYTLTLAEDNVVFEQTEDAVELGIAVHPYGAIIVPANVLDDEDTLDVIVDHMGEQYAGEIQLVADSVSDPAVPATVAGDTITLTKVV